MAERNITPSPAPRPRKRRRSRIGRVFGWIGKILGTIILVGICTGALLTCFAAVYIKSEIIPQADLVLTNFDLGQSSTMYYTNKYTGELVEMRTLYGDENRIWVSYEDIPKNLENAAIAIEDQRFKKHNGVDWYRTAGSIFYMVTGADIQGGSTITQQLIKNVTGENEVTVKRKVLEIFRALEYEKTHSKEEIMEWYLNYIYLGSGCYGVSTAAMNYFGKDVQDLTLAECASLIAITNSPTKYNPSLNPENNLSRRDLILDQMCKQGMITEAERDAAKAEELVLTSAAGAKQEKEQEQDAFSWYEDQVIDDVIQGLMESQDMSKEVATAMIYSGGLRIETCYDPEVQAYVDAVYQDRSSLELTSKTGQEIQSAITIVDNSTGGVVALAGGIGEKTSSRIFNRASDTVRPPGSSIKPLAVYAPALDMNMITPATVFDDTPIDLNGSAWPKNSYGYYKGLTTVREALQDSVNTIAVKVLRDYVTPEVSYQYMTESFGFTSLKAYMELNGKSFSDIDLAPLALGGLTEGVSTYEMAAAYAAFPNNGVYKKPHTYLRVTAVDINGNERVLLDNTFGGEPILKASTAYYINSMLMNVIQNGTGHDANFSGMTIAGKTGTTTSNNDKWFVGYSPYYTAAVWVGYDQQERIASNSYLAAQMWRKVMQPLHEGLENREFETPDNLVTVTYCKDSGMLATSACSADPRGGRVVSGTFVSGDQPTGYCTVHSSAVVCVSSPILNADGVPTGAYHLAGEFCPAESRRTVSGLAYDRERVNSSVVTRDDAYLIGSLSNRGYCTVHTSAVVEQPKEFDPDDPDTWPANDPDFDINDPTTWPNYDNEDPSPPPEESLPPTTSDPPEEPSPSTEPEPPAEPSEEPEPPPTDEPYIPVEGGE